MLLAITNVSDYCNINIEESTLIKAVIFDFDGTLVDSEWAYALTDIEFVKAIGGDSSHLDHNKYVGVGVEAFVQHFMEKLGISHSREHELIELNNKLFLDIAGDEIHTFPKMMTLIRELHKRDIPMGIASGSSQWILDTISQRCGIDRHISKIYSSQITEHEKPAPDIYLYTAKKLGVKPEECLVFEDSETGVKSGVRAGMQVVWFDSLNSKNIELKKQVFKYFSDGQDSFDVKTVLDLF